jgi:hypothetical protein
MSLLVTVPGDLLVLHQKLVLKSKISSPGEEVLEAEADKYFNLR